MWEIGQYVALCADTVVESQLLTTRITRYNEETEARTFNSNFFNSKVRLAVRGIWVQGHNGVFLPGDADTKTGQPFMEVLRKNTPQCTSQISQTWNAPPSRSTSKTLTLFPQTYQKKLFSSCLLV